MRISVITGVILCFLLVSSHAFAEGNLSDNIRIESNVLGYALQYRVYIPQGVDETQNLPTIYVTDGHGYIKEGRMAEVMDRLIAEGEMKPVIAIFVDSRNPDNLSENRRNYQLLCNEDYAKFFISELVTTIEAAYPVSRNRNDRVIQGVSFGGFNAACFGLMAYNYFGGISMHSPANSKFLRLLRDEYKNIDRLPLKIFLSFGNDQDNRQAGRQFKNVLVDKQYDLNYIEVREGHNWKNWRPLMDDALLTFFATR